MKTRHRIHPVILAHAREMCHPQTSAETTLWNVLRNKSTGYKFRRQHPIDMFIIDFYCAEAKLVIEIDGASHAELDQEEYDKARTKWLEERGYKVIRISNEDVHRHLEDALKKYTWPARNEQRRQILQAKGIRYETCPHNQRKQT
jgi:very-short-patch-repair endonuclease